MTTTTDYRRSYESTTEPAAKWGKGATVEVYRSDDGHEVRVLPGREWIEVTLPDGRSCRTCKQGDSAGRTIVCFGEMVLAEARPFADALASALGGRTEEDRVIAGRFDPDRVPGSPYVLRLKVVLDAPPMPPSTLEETDPHDGDES